MTKLISKPLELPAFVTPNRVFMAPMTRMRAAQPGDVPTDLMVEYYTQRAGAGLIVTEGSQISPEGKGYADTPGIHSDAQVAGWRKVTDAVHAAGGRISLQLWHVGRLTHETLQGGKPGVSASAIDFDGTVTLKHADGERYTAQSPTPRALEVSEIPRLIEDYRRATRNAREAGFDMVEIHGANGYLLQQFMSVSSNHRDDRYGGSLQNRARLPLEVVDALTEEWDAAHVGIRLSPMIKFGGLDDTDGMEMGLYMAAALQERGVGYLHLCEPDWAEGPALDSEFRSGLRNAFSGIIIGAGNYTVAKADEMIAEGFIDAAAFGRPFIANPDLPRRLFEELPLAEVDFDTVYGSDVAGYPQGYTDYPTAD
ncbi:MULTISPECIES: alkene reductase [Mycolicibacterium]|jgi:N-ethylmaleimide reductase|uniref:Alkene reductase n=1 Tax=Mycolicibacterium austroafricanum TaxID=39687 RepID=A0ABT8HN86_MYCAO|nr:MULTISPECIES: alkene reductase [Mycolicibacterium]MDN4522233.1 alkene reductase [Mycolicibacterium austroafricanum]MDW5613293.1 alkene reductase [Mycolicibacterium sp. D5.8-2]PQP40459.1 alkene reductase [Mycolicibacterium austroafricanum]QRZ05831.1 alkene reductase [Mycolicibacterium austroafricanum]QZT55939.1 alkene reductase [Mycolicibacterium austroafricanum]